MISSSQRPLPDNTQHSQQTNIHAPDGIGTHNVSRREAPDLRLRPRGHWDRHYSLRNGPKEDSSLLLQDRNLKSSVKTFFYHTRVLLDKKSKTQDNLNPLNAELNPICYLLALLGAHHFLHVTRIRVKSLTLRLLMSYIYMERLFLMFLDHTQRRSTVGRTPLDE